MSEILDISQSLSPAIAVWPGDTPFSSKKIMSMESGDPVNVGTIQLSVHCGTHTDAPYHFMGDGRTIDECDLYPYIGKALVVDVSGVSEITPEQLPSIESLTDIRVLFKTCTASADEFVTNFARFTIDGARELAKARPLLVGIDTPSVDIPDSKTLDAHKTFANEGIVILENLDLTHVHPGEYELIALPLKLTGMDGSPVRAILRTL